MSTAIITTYFNYNKDKKKRELLNKFVKFISDTANIKDLYLCEISATEKSELVDINIPNHYWINNPDQLWHKETAINFLLKKLPNEYTNVVIFDADIELSDSDWLSKTESALESHIMVQPFEYIKYVGPSDSIVDNFYPSITKHMSKHSTIDYGNPGVCIAYNRNYLDAVGGLFDKCILGGGDSINIIPFFLNSFIKLSIFNRVSLDVRCELLSYLDRCIKFIRDNNAKATYIKDCIAIHGFHGPIKNRQYDERYSLLMNSRFDDLVYKDSNGFYKIHKHTNLGQIFNDFVASFFSNREIWNLDNTFAIFNTNKSGITNDIFWLSDNDYFTFHKIQKVRMHFRKNQDIEYLFMFANNKKIDIGFIDDECMIEIDNPKTLNINSDYFVPKETGAGTDVRRLSIYLTKIEVIPVGGSEYIEYSIHDIF
jgi:hypothetical protein